MTTEEGTRIVDDVVAKLMEHFEVVHILASRQLPDGTELHSRGAGNWYARQGMAHEFIEANVSQGAAHQIAAEINSRPDDGDEWKIPII